MIQLHHHRKSPIIVESALIRQVNFELNGAVVSRQWKKVGSEVWKHLRRLTEPLKVLTFVASQLLIYETRRVDIHSLLAKRGDFTASRVALNCSADGEPGPASWIRAESQRSEASNRNVVQQRRKTEVEQEQEGDIFVDTVRRQVAGYDGRRRGHGPVQDRSE